MKTKILLVAAVGFASSACSQPATPPAPALDSVVAAIEENPVPGTVQGAWTEPMADTIRVPGQIDPTNTYYRLPHNTVVEVRPGKFQEVQYPDGKRQEEGK